jgi:hypothetical protein
MVHTAEPQVWAVVDEDRDYAGSRFAEVVDFHHPTWREDRNDPKTATRIDGRKVR